jgi:hypothetical protein
MTVTIVGVSLKAALITLSAPCNEQAASGRFGKPGKLFERSEFLPGWKKLTAGRSDNNI